MIFKYFCTGLNSYPASIDLNQETLPPTRDKGHYSITTGFEEFETDCGNITVFAKTVRSNHRENAAQTRQRLEGGNMQDLFFGRLKFVPNGSSLQAVMTASFTQRVRNQISQSLNFNISFRNRIPDDSDIFRFVADGNLNAIIGLFREGLASLTDCDTSGRSLLSVCNIHFYFD
jgi:hypothetical protein